MCKLSLQRLFVHAHTCVRTIACSCDCNARKALSYSRTISSAIVRSKCKAEWVCSQPTLQPETPKRTPKPVRWSKKGPILEVKGISTRLKKDYEMMTSKALQLQSGPFKGACDAALKKLGASHMTMSDEAVTMLQTAAEDEVTRLFERAALVQMYVSQKKRSTMLLGDFRAAVAVSASVREGR